MASGDRGCCDKCAKTFIMVVNIVIVLGGGAILGAGVYWQTSDTGFYKEIFNHNIFNVPIIAIVIGSLLLVVGLAGFIGACCEVLFLLKVYMGLLIIIMLLEIAFAVGCVAMKSSVEDYSSTRTLELMGYYGDDTKDEAGVITKTIDLLQENFECCGVDGPSDWPEKSTLYADDSVPNSCCMAEFSSDDTCGSVEYTTNTKIYTTGCKTSMINFVENNLLYVGIVGGIIVILQISIAIMTSSFRTTLEDESYINI